MKNYYSDFDARNNSLNADADYIKMYIDGFDGICLSVSNGSNVDDIIEFVDIIKDNLAKLKKGNMLNGSYETPSRN